MELLPRVLDMLHYSETILPSRKAFHLLNKMRYILCVVVLLEACDVTNNGGHLGFYRELEIRLKSRYSQLSLDGHLYKMHTSVKRTPTVGPCLSLLLLFDSL